MIGDPGAPEGRSLLRYVVVAVLVATSLLSGVLMFGFNDTSTRSPLESDGTPPAFGSQPTRGAEGTPRFVPSLPTATAVPTAVLPRSNPHPAIPRSMQLAYFHIAPDQGEPAETLAARASFLTLTHGDEEYRDQLRNAGFEGRILQFLVSSEVNGPGPYANATADCDENFRPLRNGIARQPGEFCRDIHPHEDWFLHNGAGERLYDRVGDTGVWYHMNPDHPGWREYAVSRIRKDAVGSNALGFDGIFLDNVELSLLKVEQQLSNSDGTVQEFASDDEYRAAWISYIERISSDIRPEVELWTNMTADPNDGSSWDPYLAHIDGAMFPSFATGYHGLSPSRWLNNLTQAEAALDSGTQIVAVGLGNRADLQLQSFAAGSFLLISRPEQSFFRYVSSESRAALSSFWLYENYDVTLGEPLGPRYRTGSAWRRDFNCGYVVVDPSERTADIVQTECAVWR